MNIEPLIYIEEKGNNSIRNYENYLSFKQAHASQWSNLLKNLQKNENFGRIRDMTYSTVLHSYKVSIPFMNYKGGLVLCISMLNKNIGLYYDYGEVISAELLHIYDYRGKRYDKYLSYFPGKQIHEALGRVAIGNAMSCFVGFQKFDNFYATIELENLDLAIFSNDKLNIFQLFFCSNIHGII